MKNKRENGEVVVEASIIVTLVLILISIMFYIGMAMYQQTTISVVANRTATSISQVYSNTLRDPFTGYIDPDNAYQSITYSNMKTDAYLDSIKQKGTAFVQYRLKKSQIIPAVGREVDVQVVNKPNEILKGQIVVTITDTYDVPLVGIFGADGKLSFTGTGRADCVDYLEYLLGVEAIANPEESSITPIPESDTCIVTFVKDKYSGGFHAAVPVLRGKTIITSNRHSHSTMPNNPELNGMKFTGWVTTEGRRFSASVQVDENITVYGTWECTVTLDPTGGKVSPSKLVVPYHHTVSLPTPERKGYAFEGWFTEKDGGGTQYYSDATEISGNIKLYAKWRCLHQHMYLSTRKRYLCREVNGQPESYEIYKCSGCDLEQKYSIDNKHYVIDYNHVNTNEVLEFNDEFDDFNSQCDVDHLDGSYEGYSGSYESGFSNGITIYEKYHVTCDFCGMHLPPVMWDNISGELVYKEIFWLTNKESRKHTPCRTPDYKYVP